MNKVASEIINKYEDLKITPKTTNGFNEIWFNDEEVGTIDLIPANKEYYWLDLNELPIPLAISDIEIHSKFRNNGYMTKVMNWLEEFAKSNGFGSLFLRVDNNSEIKVSKLESIYHNFGFINFEKQGKDIYMYKLL